MFSAPLRDFPFTAAKTRTLPPSRILASAAISRRLSTTTRSGWRGVSTSRTVSRGLSALTVPMPVRTAQARARQRWPSRRASGPVIHCERPSARAVRPSSVAASFKRTQGRPRVTRETKPMLSSLASSSIRPCSKRMPAAARRSPPPLAAGFGSRIAATTRAIFLLIKASAHGGVRPWWPQGSRFTYAVAPSARVPALSSAITSACGAPAFSCHPSPTIVSSFARTQPTRGFGVVV